MPPDAVTYLPIAVVGIWRWSVWLGKLCVARLYSPYSVSDEAVPMLSEFDVSIVTPVYRPDTDEFMSAVRSWHATDPHEIIVVIDAGDTEVIRRFREYADDHDDISCVVTPKPGKRPALVDGVRLTSGDIVALVDDDVKWRPSTKHEFLKPFLDRNVGAVSPQQKVDQQRTVPQRLYEIQMRLQFAIDYPALSHVSRSLSCVSGRTAVYRREALLPVIDGLTDETFLGKEVISGDDKYLTRAVQRSGWDAVYQSTSIVDIGAVPDVGQFFSQTVRWTRNTIRSDIKAFSERWIFERKWLAYYTLDRFVATFAILMAPVYFTLSLSQSAFLVSGAILLWWSISRSFKMFPFLQEYPKRLHYVPLYTLGSFVSSPIYLYALYSANTQGWLTRGDDSRYGFDQFRQKAITTLSVILAVATIICFIYILLLVKYETV
jgi:hyaluronan synthase